MSEFTCHGEALGDSRGLVVVAGELDLATSDQLLNVLEELHGEGVDGHLVIDLSEVTFIDSTALGVLVAERRKADGPVHIVVTAPLVRKVFAITALDHVFSLHDTRDEALASLG